MVGESAEWKEVQMSFWHFQVSTELLRIVSSSSLMFLKHSLSDPEYKLLPL